MSNRPTVTLAGARGAEWTLVLGTPTLPILSSSPETLRLEGSGDKFCVMLDVPALNRVQQAALVQHLAHRFNAPAVDVERDVFTRGVPIQLDADTSIVLPEGYQQPLLAGPVAFDLRFF